MVADTRAPWNNYVLTPGQRCAVPPRTAHDVHGEEQVPWSLWILQGVGVYGFLAAGG